MHCLGMQYQRGKVGRSFEEARIVGLPVSKERTSRVENPGQAGSVGSQFGEGLREANWCTRCF